jgi:hypothetical protein
VAVSGELIFVADLTNLGIYRYTGPGAVSDENNAIPLSFALYPAYPNPFNSSATIRFAVSRPGQVSLEVYDPLGRRVRELTPAGWFGAGLHTLPLDGANLPAGSYFIVLDAGEDVLAAPVTVVK